MKIILEKGQIKNLLNEELGISRICVTYSNIILNKVIPFVVDFIKTKKPIDKKIKITLSELKDAWMNNIDDYLELPISEIRIDLKNVLEKESTDYFTTAGGAEQIDNKSTKFSYLTTPPTELPKYIREQIDSTLNARFELEISLGKKVKESQIDEIIYDLRDTILHETNHMLEFFKKNETGLGFVNVALNSPGGKNYNIPIDIFSIWEEFLLFVYFSQPHEMRAMIQEMYSQRLRKPFEEFKEHRYYETAKIMEKFNADEMYEKLSDVIESYDPNLQITILTNLWKWFMDDYLEMSKDLKLTPEKKIVTTVHVLQLMKVLQPRINKSGIYLQRKFNSLYSLETN